MQKKQLEYALNNGRVAEKYITNINVRNRENLSERKKKEWQTCKRKYNRYYENTTRIRKKCRAVVTCRCRIYKTN